MSSPLEPITTKPPPIWRRKLWQRRFGLVAAALVALGAAKLSHHLGDGYIDRLPNHHGYHLVKVDESLAGATPSRPKRTVLVVIDGLRKDAAGKMRSIRKLASAGQCQSTSVGDLTISRPVYSMLSTGLEVDRLGSRNNDETTPVAGVSIWQVARRHGLRVNGFSELRWWFQLFPDGFDHYSDDPDHDADHFARAELGDLTLIHPGYVDNMGHAHGADSPEYRAAVERVDDELSQFLSRLDLDQDTIVVTSDHGHLMQGGHGSGQKELSEVLTCFAGHGLRAAREVGANDEVLDARIIAPLISVVLAVPFPPHMRAGDDSLDQIWPLVDEATLGAPYIAQRKAAVAAFRAQNNRAIAEWSGDSISWTGWYTRARRRQLGRAAVALLVFIIVVCVVGRWRKFTAVEIAGQLTWMVGAFVACALAYVQWRGSFDFASINARELFVDSSLGSCAIGLTLACVVHVVFWRDNQRLALDMFTLTASIVWFAFAHRLVYGAPLGFPLPSDLEIFLPFFFAAVGIVSGLCAIALALFAALRLKR